MNLSIDELKKIKEISFIENGISIKIENGLTIKIELDKDGVKDKKEEPSELDKLMKEIEKNAPYKPYEPYTPLNPYTPFPSPITPYEPYTGTPVNPTNPWIVYCVENNSINTKDVLGDKVDDILIGKYTNDFDSKLSQTKEEK